MPVFKALRNKFSGDDGQDFITVEHCGDDFLAALAESMQGSEDWEDLQAIETEACGTLNEMFEKDVLNNHEAPDDDNGITYTPQNKKRQQVWMQLDSSE